MSALDLEKILSYAKQNQVSDVHLSEKSPITFRVQGQLMKLDDQPTLEREHLLSLKDQMLAKYPEKLRELEETGDVDFAFMSSDGTSYRVNGFFKLERLAFVMRRIENEVMGIEDLGLPESVEKFIAAKQGLVLVT